MHNLAKGKPLPEGETPERLAGLAAYVHMTDAEEGAARLRQIRERQ